ncbi:MAG: hypothetical protein KDA41_18255 [Planctomycetales bacterium]|nr:hypothetical protein [Planctomycetales bacterium]
MNQSEPSLPPYGRLIAAGMAAAAAVGLAANHFLEAPPSVARLLLLAFGPMALLLGAGGLIEPRIVWSLGKYGKDLPVVYKAIGGALAAAGLVVTLLLITLVYPLNLE